MELTIERDDNALTASVNGRIDSTNARDFEEAIRTKIEDGDRAVIMDFEKLSYISSAGLRAVLMTAKTLWKRDAKFAL
ncbi:MAG: STAS domain-containing protein, partial [Rhodospirillaceae bacterium]|nr:STAS domain-containing protein [Rhodospirillaceae bacterium]